MIDEKTKKEKITRFLNDEMMAESVYSYILKRFLKQKERTDIHMSAAERVAIDLLNEAWSDMETIKKRKESEQKEQRGQRAL